MVHLSIVHALMDDLPKEYDRDVIYLGSLAPDAIHMREDFIRKMKYKTHLRYGREGNVIEKLLALEPEPMNAFKLGYGIHVITDILWLYNIYYPFKERLLDRSKEERDLIYYGETDQLDFVIYNESPWQQEVFDAITRAKAPDDFQLLSKKEIEGWKQHILHWFDDGESRHDRAIKYLTMSKIESFIEETIVEVRNRLREMI